MREHGAARDGKPQVMDRRLFVQLLVWTGCNDIRSVIDAVAAGNHPGVVYKDMNDPTGIGVLTLTEDPELFVGKARELFEGPAFDTPMSLRHQMTMIGRTYSMGYEPDLEDALIHRPTRYMLNRNWPWAIWYPLRRAGTFNHLPPEEQRNILMEHGTIGRSFGEANLAHDVRLMSYGMDTQDNDFTIGLLGENLHPLSAIVQAMRKTQQTSLYLTSLGPFFVGRVAWQSPAS